MPIPKSVRRTKKKAQPLPRARIYLPPEFEQGLAMMAGAAEAIGAANAQIADEATSAFIAIDRRRAGLARPMSATDAFAEYGPEIEAATRIRNHKSLGDLKKFRSSPAYDAAVGSVAITPDLTLLHRKTWKGLQRPALTQLR